MKPTIVALLLAAIVLCACTPTADPNNNMNNPSNVTADTSLLEVTYAGAFSPQDRQKTTITVTGNGTLSYTVFSGDGSVTEQKAKQLTADELAQLHGLLGG